MYTVQCRRIRGNLYSIFGSEVFVRVGNSPFRLKSLILKSDREQSLLLLFKDEQCEWIAGDSSELLAKNERIAWKIHIFCMFFQFLCPIANHSSQSLLICSFLKSHLSDLLPLLFIKKQQWAIGSDRSWQKSKGSDLLVFTSESLFRSFAHKKRANCSKNPWAMSQPWYLFSRQGQFVSKFEIEK